MKFPTIWKPRDLVEVVGNQLTLRRRVLRVELRPRDGDQDILVTVSVAGNLTSHTHPTYLTGCGIEVALLLLAASLCRVLHLQPFGSSVNLDYGPFSGGEVNNLGVRGLLRAGIWVTCGMGIEWPETARWFGSSTTGLSGFMWRLIT